MDFQRIEARQLTNVAELLRHAAQQVPHHVAVAVAKRPVGCPPAIAPDGRPPIADPRDWRTIQYAELDEMADAIARGLREAGIPRGTRLALMVRPGVEFVALVFGLMRAGMVQILIDPGMGRKHMLQCLVDCVPEGFVGIPLAQALRVVFRKKLSAAKHNITVGRRWFWGGWTYEQILRAGRANKTPTPGTDADDQAAIIFTTGSTGPPKGVYYSHRMFIEQATQIRDFYGIQPGGADVSGFPLFALFNIGMGVTTVIPWMDPTRPAQVDPRQIIGAARQWQANQSFGSPALWNTVSRYCVDRGETLPQMERVFSAGAPVPPHVLHRVRQTIAPDGEVYTPYGATEALPVASNSATVVLSETAEHTNQGRGTCVGSPFPGIQWKVIEISDDPIAELADCQECKAGDIGELMVSGPVVSPKYVTRPEANEWHKVLDSTNGVVWHRMGDVGYLDDLGRFWFCGRKGHRVVTATETLFTIPVEAIFNTLEPVYRSALVGVGPQGRQVPVLILEPWPEHWPKTPAEERGLLSAAAKKATEHPHTTMIKHFFLMKQLPVDIRHNSKIFREKLSVWAATRLAEGKN